LRRPRGKPRTRKKPCTGKSTIVEKLTNERGRASDKDISVIKSSEVFWTTDGSIVISDMPGSNAMEDKLEHNVWIASALNFRPVSKIFILHHGQG